MTSISPERLLSIHVEAATPTFADYQTIHQEQERQRYPNQTRKPATSDSWKQKGKLWLAFFLSSGLGYWLMGPGKWLSWAFLTLFFTGIGLLYQLYEYRKAYRQISARLHPSQFRVSQNGVKLTFPRGEAFYTWSEFYRIQHLSPWLLLYTSVEHSYYLDMRRIAPPATSADLLALLPT
ncbi:hypothetical protein [Hymenobacter sp. DG25A]|uniref:hypothetical protein n=1 Tax=Hymenobacter sp. DG25A TaxID=1385663 RepID=UPI000A3EC4F3|nr:hypothetical protein [Hymenobacter sp. DG25A]